MRIRSLVACCLGVLVLACSGDEPQRRATGEPCAPVAPGAESLECSDKLCVALDDASGFCTRSCSEDSQCPADFKCEAAGRYGKICKKLTGCTADGECPAGHSCNPETGNCFIEVSRTLCSPCQDTAQCPAGGACFTAIGSGEQFCTVACGENGACPAGFGCEQIPAGPGGAVVAQCVPLTQTCNAGKPLCTPCIGDDECGGEFDLCVRNVVSGERFCGRDCDPDRVDGCPDGFTCVDIGQSDDENLDGPYQCVPNSNTCEGFCDATDEAGQTAQCGLGRQCNLTTKQCEPATDGRQCASCLDNDDCTSGGHPENRCILNDCQDCPFKGESFCATECADDAACLQSFGPGFVCQSVAYEDGTRKFCMPQRGTCATGLGRLGDDCSLEGAQGCVAGVCVVAGNQSFCSLSCAADSDCKDTRYRCCEATANGYDCSDAQRKPDGSGPLDGSGVCAPLGGLFGDDCTPGRPPCQTGTCLDLGTARVCTNLCDQGCPAGFTCRTAKQLDSDVEHSVCFPEGGGQSGASCAFGPAACESGLCVRKDSGPVCTNECQSDSGCPEGWKCTGVSTVNQLSIQACLPPAVQ